MDFATIRSSLKGLVFLFPPYFPENWHITNATCCPPMRNADSAEGAECAAGV